MTSKSVFSFLTGKHTYLGVGDRLDYFLLLLGMLALVGELLISYEHNNSRYCIPF